MFRRRKSEPIEATHMDCLLSLVKAILSDRTIETVTYQDDTAALSVSRATTKRSEVCAMGFAASDDDEDEADENDEDDGAAYTLIEECKKCK